MLTSRWTALRKHATQAAYWNSAHRFNVLPPGRRSGKTELFKRKLVKRALRGTDYDDPRFFAAAPTRDQAKAIFWADLKKLIPSKFMLGPPSESELKISLINGAEIWVLGMDKPERIEGRPWDGGGLDEYGNMKPQTWGEHVRPSLSDRLGWCDFIGVPEGRNHYYQTYRSAAEQHRELNGASPWATFHWPSWDILPDEEVEQARRDLDELTFRQEYGGEFINFHGRAYYAFSEITHCTKLAYDPKQPLIFCFDFNVAPGVAAICQEQPLPSGENGTGVIGEVWIPRNSNTESVCRRLVLDWKDHEGRIVCYGDASGGARGSAKLTGSDWDIIRRELRAAFGDRVLFRVPRANPSQRSRINAMNTRLKSGDGRIRLMVDPGKAPHVVQDLEGVRLLEGGSGEIDKKIDPELTHLSDALGYYIYYEFPINDNHPQLSRLPGLY